VEERGEAPEERGEAGWPGTTLSPRFSLTPAAVAARARGPAAGPLAALAALPSPTYSDTQGLIGLQEQLLAMAVGRGCARAARLAGRSLGALLFGGAGRGGPPRRWRSPLVLTLPEALWGWPWELAWPPGAGGPSPLCARGPLLRRPAPAGQPASLAPWRAAPTLGTAGLGRLVVASAGLSAAGEAAFQRPLGALRGAWARAGGPVTVVPGADAAALDRALGEGADWLILHAHGDLDRLLLARPVGWPALRGLLAGRLRRGLALTACHGLGAPGAVAAGPSLGLLADGLPELIGWTGAPTVEAATRLLGAVAPHLPDRAPVGRAAAIGALRRAAGRGWPRPWDGVQHAVRGD
jgi:hypothetical protein